MWSAAVALFVAGDEVAGHQLLLPSADGGTRDMIYGIAAATFHAGTWSFRFDFENRPFDGRGHPRSFFDGRTVIAGSAEEDALVTDAVEQAADRVAREQGRGARRSRGGPPR